MKKRRFFPVKTLALLSILLSCAILLPSMSAEASDLPISGDGYSYDTASNTLTIETNDASFAWRNNGGLVKQVQSVVCTDAVTEVYSGAFDGCTSLTELEMPAVTELGSGAFSGCTSLTHFSLPEVRKVGASAFKRCEELVEADLPVVETLETESFYECSSLSSVNLPKVTTIGSDAFSGAALTRISLPQVTSIGSNAFGSGLKEIALPSAPPSIGAYSFNNFEGSYQAILVDSMGNELTGAALKAALRSYKTDSFYTDEKWSRWTLPTELYTVSGIVTRWNTEILTVASLQLQKDGVDFGSPIESAANGTFIFTDIPKGVYSIVAKGNGYHTLITSEFSVDDDILDMRVELRLLSVTSITGIPDSVAAGETLRLNATVEPSNANNQTIVWSIKDAGTTSAVLENGVVKLPKAGTLVLTATIYEGITPTEDYVQDFTILVTAPATPSPSPTASPAPLPSVSPSPSSSPGKIAVERPALKNSYYLYSGSPIQAEFTDYDASIIRSSETAGTEPGTYVTTLQLVDPDRYEWDTPDNKGGGWAYTWYIIADTPKQSVTSGSTSVVVEGLDQTTFDPQTELSVTEQGGLDAYEESLERLAPGKIFLTLYDIKLSLNGEEIQPSGRIKIKLPLTEEQMSHKNLQAVYIDASGEIHLAESTVVDGYLELITDHLSYYGIVGDKSAGSTPTAAPTSTPKPTGPSTGDQQDFALLYVGMALSLAMGILLIVRSRRCRK